MAINYTRLFTTLGRIIEGVNEINTARYATLNSRVDAIADRYESVFQDQIPDLFSTRDQALNSLGSLTSYYRTLAERTLIKEVQADNATIPSDVTACLLELRRQMKVDASSLQNASLASAVSSVFLNGNIGTVPADYMVNNLLVGTFDETFFRPDEYYITPSLGSDNGATEYQETFSIKGEEFAFDRLDPRWPSGENVATSVKQIDPTIDDWFTAEATAGDWTETTVPGTASVDVRGTTTTVYSKASAGTSDNFLVLKQAVGTNIRPNTWYCAYILVQQNSTQTLDVTATLETGTGGVMYAGAEVSATETFTVNTGTDIWQTVGVLFRTKEKIPDVATLAISLTATGAAVTVRACYPNLTEANVVELYPLGPAIALLSGNYPAVAPNVHVVTVGAHTTTPEMVQGLERLFDASQVLVQGWPVASSPTISDGLIV